MDSNLNNSVGFFNAKGLGPRIMLGTDGMHSDMLRSARSAYFAGHDHEEISFSETCRRFRNVHDYLAGNNFTGDSDNNLVVLAYDPPTPFSSANFAGHLLYGLDAGQVSHVISQGRLIVENGRLLTVDEPAILEESRKQAVRLWERMTR
jgi:cytosine/adenosine deaminase-related metal-dependent hydrolase